MLREFRDKVLPEAFPDRDEVPKTLIFAKDDSHADDIVRIAREEFGEGNDFCQKITYRTGFTRVTKTVTEEDGTETQVTDWVRTASLTPDEILANFRNSFFPRIAVTVDMISTGTDVRPIECVFFMRNVRSAGFFEQMKGRAVRVISPDKLRTVTPSASGKDRFIVVDAVGVCEEDKTDSRTLNRQPSKTLEQLLNYIARGGIDPEALTTLAGRLSRLQREFAPAQLAELKGLAEGKSFPDLARDLLNACDPDAQLKAAQEHYATGHPTEEEIEQAGKQLAREAVTPFLNAAFRRRILEIRQQNEQTIDRHTIDDVLYSGFDAAAVEKARAKVQDFRVWIEDHRGRTHGSPGAICRDPSAPAVPERPARVEGCPEPAADFRQPRPVVARLRGGRGGQGRGARRIPTGGSRQPRASRPGPEPDTGPVSGGVAGALPGLAAGTGTPTRPSPPSSGNGSTAWPSTSPRASPSRRMTSRLAGSGSRAASAGLTPCSVRS